MLSDLLSDVAEFHAKFRHFIASKLIKVPEVPYQVRLFRMERIQEETKELIEAIQQGKLHKIAREGVDLVYVVLGTFVLFGIPFYPMWRAVHESNMAKTFTGPLEKPGKPEGWVSPDQKIQEILTGIQEQQAEEEAAARRGDEEQAEEERYAAELDKATPPDGGEEQGSESGATTVS